ncbi:hypothetical protein GS399_02445 [Pedobacter sp. HMF7647]|uniref:Uncharacterized protein n=1 Tax=Hufsiella arboris TaxID=2695275 RepID=A0A7K1Y5E8_9SPHI|nr:hypothetical protein [Hufsiella arboris]MXV49814.1 hypothetical protein [Hufsiella arboris]
MQSGRGFLRSDNTLFSCVKTRQFRVGIYPVFGGSSALSGFCFGSDEQNEPFRLTTAKESTEKSPCGYLKRQDKTYHIVLSKTGDVYRYEFINAEHPLLHP